MWEGWLWKSEFYKLLRTRSSLKYVVCIKKSCRRIFLNTCIYLHCVRRLSWSATTLDTLRLTKIAFVFTWKFPQTRKLFINLREKLGWRKSSIPFGWANFRACDKARYITNFCHNIDLTIGTPFSYKALPPLRYWCLVAIIVSISISVTSLVELWEQGSNGSRHFLEN